MFQGLILILAAAAEVAPAAAPRFEDALAEARRAGKPLVVDFGASWCEPCKQMDADLARPEGQAALQGLHFVRYDVDVAPGTAVRDKFKVTAFPTVMAVDPDGKEVDRMVGYGDFRAFRTWLEAVPEKAVTLTACLSSANRDVRNSRLQLVAGKRLLSARRPGEARRYLSRAAAASDETIASPASWALAEAEASAAALPFRRKHAERVAARFPTTGEGLKAFRFLATLPEAPRPLVAGLVEKRLAVPTIGANPAQLEELALYALRAGAVDAAARAADRLEAIKDANRLSTVAEVRHMQGNSAQAVALGEKAVAAAGDSQRGALNRDLARFRRGEREPSPALAALTPEGDDGRRSETRRPPAYFALMPKISEKGRGCAPADEPLGDVEVHILSGERPEDLRVVTGRPVPPAVAQCLTKGVREVAVPANQSFSMSVSLDPPWFAQGLALGRKTAQACLPAPKEGEKPEATRVLITADQGGAHVVTAGGQSALETCIARAFWFLRPPPGTVRVVLLTPARPKATESKVVAAQAETR